MPIPKAIGRFNRAVFNRLSRRVMHRLPGFGVVEHRGRRSGRTFRTPVNVFPTDDGYVFALTYGIDSDWVKNVQAAGECALVTRGRRVHLVEPRLYHDETRRHIRAVERWFLGRLGVADFLALRVAPDAGRSR